MVIVLWFVMSVNLVFRVVVIVFWILLGLVGVYLVIGGDWRVLVFNLLCIVILIIIYYLFVKMYDKRLFYEEKVEE